MMSKRIIIKQISVIIKSLVYNLCQESLRKPPNRIKAHPIIEAQSQGYNFPDILEAHPIPNKNKTDNFKKI